MEIKSPKANSAEIYEIPEDLVTEILIRTPVESILKFRCVSKSWCALISSKSFIGSQLDFSKKKTDNVRIIFKVRTPDDPRFELSQYYLKALLNNKSDDTAPEFYYPWVTTHSTDLQFIGSCNGLCCAILIEKPVFAVEYSRREKSMHVFVWNPSTRMSRELFCMNGVLNYLSCRYYLSYCYGFGFYGDDYKFVVVHPFHNYPSLKHVYLYSLKSNSRKTSIKSLAVDLGMCDVPGKFANGKLYWMVTTGPSKKALFYFDLGTELFGMIEPPPSSLIIEPSSIVLEMFEERICLVFCEASRLYMWVLKDESSWEKMISVLPLEPNLGIPIWLPEEGEILMRHEFRDKPTIVYDPKRNSCRHSVVIPGWISRTQVYVTSLVSPLLDDCEPNEEYSKK